MEYKATFTKWAELKEEESWCCCPSAAEVIAKGGEGLSSYVPAGMFSVLLQTMTAWIL